MRRVNSAASEVFVTSPWIPAEWIKAHGLVPRGLWVTSLPQPLSVSAGICAFAQAMLTGARTSPATPVVFSSACDQMRRAFDAVIALDPSRSFLFNVPATRHTPVGRRTFLAELKRLGSFLEARGGRAPTADQLSAVIRDYDRQRRCLRQAAGDLPARAFAEAVAAFHWTGEAALPPERREVAPQAVPLALVGGPLPAAHWGLLDAIENAGGQIALNATESGERSLFPCWDPAVRRPDPLDALVDAYWENGVDVFQRPNNALYHWLRERMRARRIRGIVLWSFVGCDLWRAEAPSLREFLGLPVLLLDGNENPSGAARDSGRLQAFLEMLQ